MRTNAITAIPRRRVVVTLAMLSVACHRPPAVAPRVPRDVSATQLPARAADASAVTDASAVVARAPARTLLARWPSSGASITTARPTLRWSDEGAVHLDLCRDRACAQPIRSVAAEGGRYTVDTPLEGRVFWRLRTDAPDVAPSSPRWFRVSRHPAGRDAIVASTFDVNGDGLGDVLLNNRLYLGSATAPYLTAAPRQAPCGADARLVVAGDLNGDGHSDVVVTNQHARPLRVHFGGDDGLDPTPAVTLTAPERSATWGSTATDAGDVDGDGYDDLVVGVSGRSVVYLFAGSAAGPGAQPAVTFRRWPRSQPNLGTDVAGLHDMNGDGYADVGATTYEGMGDLGIYLGASSWPAAVPTWTYYEEYAGGHVAQVLAAGDIDGDGYADALGSDFSSYPNCGTSGWIRGSAAGPVTPSHPPASAGLRRALQHCDGDLTAPRGDLVPAGDVDGDGYWDLLGLDESETRHPWKLLRGGPMGPEVGVPITTARFAGDPIVLGDVDGDGRDDLGLLQGTGAVLRLLRGRAPGEAAAPVEDVRLMP